MLRRADLIACEDTRITARLLARYDVTTTRISYHEHNAERVLPRIMARLLAGECVVLVSDAGTPLISDPGYRLIRAALDAGHAVIPLPGPSAVIAALVASGLPTDRFYFAGFPPTRRAARRRAITENRRVVGHPGVVRIAAPAGAPCSRTWPRYSARVRRASRAS